MIVIKVMQLKWSGPYVTYLDDLLVGSNDFLFLLVDVEDGPVII